MTLPRAFEGLVDGESLSSEVLDAMAVLERGQRYADVPPLRSLFAPPGLGLGDVTAAALAEFPGGRPSA